jgi:glycosyltransferase involved in cell wall biosynthesis
MSQGLVSVIIPTYNRAERLSEAIRSALAQTYTKLEAIVIDDGSTDDTAEVVGRVMRKDPRVRYIHQRNRGVAAARNFGISHLRGEYVAFLDSDDVWEPWKLELQVACIKQHRIGMVWTDMTAVDPCGQVIYPRYLRKMYAAYRHFEAETIFSRHYEIRDIAPQLVPYVPAAKLSVGDIFSQMITGNLVHTSTVLLTRERLERVDQFNEEFNPSGEDYDFHLRTCREGDVGFINVSSIRYQIGGPDQLTNRAYSIEISRNFLKTIEPVIAKERHRISLSEPVLNGTLAYGYRWLGTELLLSGNHGQARTALNKSLRLKWSPFTAALLAACLLPGQGVQLLRRIASPVYRTVAARRAELYPESPLGGRIS